MKNESDLTKCYMKIVIINNLERLRMKVSKHFKRKEFACGDGCGFDTVDVELIDLLEAVRDHFNQPVTITSACRCREHNDNVGGAKKSKHLLGIAADIVVKETSPQYVYDFVCLHMPDKGGFILYKEKNFCHVDVRPDKYRNVV